MFRFVLGLLSGVAIGVAAASMSQGQSGQDLRAEFDRIRNDLQQGNFDALGAHLEERFKELQASLEERFAEVEEQAADATPTRRRRRRGCRRSRRRGAEEAKDA